jgi:mannose-6-phosphate isomerase-like protein (cupin superfamily)
VGTLLAIVLALDMSLDQLFSDVEPRSAGTAASPPASGSSPSGTVLRASDRRSVDLAGGVRWERLTPDSESRMSFLYVTYGVGGASCPPGTMMQHDGREFGVVLRGRLGAQIGNSTYDLGPGDAIRMDCVTPHRFWAIGNEPAIAVWTIITPAQAARLGSAEGNGSGRVQDR